MTIYHFDFAADRWEIALEIEADRMRNVRIDAKHEFEQEKGAVVAELEGGEDNPWDLEYKAILPLLWPKESPYSHPVIGQREHVRGATAEVIKRYYDKWYHPNNAALVVVGGFDPDAALKKIKQLFGPIPKARTAAPEESRRTTRSATEPVRKEFESKFDVPRLMVGFNTVPVGTPDDPILDVISDVLSAGKTSRLYRKLVEDERIASDVERGQLRRPLPRLVRGERRTAARARTARRPRSWCSRRSRNSRPNRSRTRNWPARGGRFWRRSSSRARAFTASPTRSPAPAPTPAARTWRKFFADYLDAIGKVSKADIQRVAKQYLARKQAAIVWSVPKEEKGGGAKTSRPASLKARAESNPSARTRVTMRRPYSPSLRERGRG